MLAARKGSSEVVQDLNGWSGWIEEVDVVEFDIPVYLRRLLSLLRRTVDWWLSIDRVKEFSCSRDTRCKCCQVGSCKT